MATVTICSDFGGQEIKSVTFSIVSPSIFHDVMGLDAMILLFECWVLNQFFLFFTLPFHFFKVVRTGKRGPKCWWLNRKILWKWNKRKPMDWSKNFRWKKHTPFLASPIWIGKTQQGGDKWIKGGSQDRLRPFPLGSVCPHPGIQGVLSFACQIKLSCNQAVTLTHCFKFLLQQDRTEEIIHSPDSFIKRHFRFVHQKEVF